MWNSILLSSDDVEARQDVSDRTPLLFSPVRCLLDLVHPLYKELLLQEGVSSIPLHRCYFTVVSCRVFLPWDNQDVRTDNFRMTLAKASGKIIVPFVFLYKFPGKFFSAEFCFCLRILLHFLRSQGWDAFSDFTPPGKARMSQWCSCLPCSSCSEAPCFCTEGCALWTHRIQAAATAQSCTKWWLVRFEMPSQKVVQAALQVPSCWHPFLWRMESLLVLFLSFWGTRHSHCVGRLEAEMLWPKRTICMKFLEGEKLCMCSFTC